MYKVVDPQMVEDTLVPVVMLGPSILHLIQRDNRN